MGSFGYLLYDIVFQDIIERDMLLATGSGLFVFVFVWFHLESFFMALLALLMIMFSFPVAYLIYSGIFGITMNTSLNRISIFIVLGIAADDLFVFCDAWRQSELVKSLQGCEKRRMAYTFRRSFQAIAVTSSTTAAAFLATTASKIKPIKSFGIYAAIVVPLNFVMIVLMMPSIQIFHDRQIMPRCAKRKCCCVKKKATNPEEKQKADRLTRCFSGPFNKCVKKARWCIVVVFFLVGIVAAGIAA